MKIKFLLFTLAVFAVGVFFQTGEAQALAQQSRPWDCVVNTTFEGANFTYTLSDNCKGISSQSLQSRAVYGSAHLKKERAKQLAAQGYSPYEIACYLLPNIYKVLEKIEKSVYLAPVDATLSFYNNAFTYTDERQGRQFEREKFCQKLLENLSCQNDVKMQISPLAPFETKNSLVQRTTLRGSYTTDFSFSGQNRRHNIALALSNFDCLEVKNGQKVSFNQVVGERTEKRGYKTSKIIIDGKYTEGIGGGVCQASTAIYNAALTAGLTVNSRSRHTLVSHYVEESFDAMVSSSTDLVFTNDTQSDIFIGIVVSNGRATVYIYGTPNEYQIKRVSQVVERKAPNERVIIDQKGDYSQFVTYSDEQFVLENGSDYVVSKAYLEKYKQGKLLEKKLLSVDTYKGADRVVVWGGTKREEKQPLLSPDDIFFLPIKQP